MVRWASCVPVSIPSTSQAAATVINTNHGAVPTSAFTAPPRPRRGHGSLAGSSRHPGLLPVRPSHKDRSIATTTHRETSQVAIAP